jgi:hypothetical protein
MLLIPFFFLERILSLKIKEFHNVKIIAAGCQNGMLYVSISKQNKLTGNFGKWKNIFKESE